MEIAKFINRTTVQYYVPKWGEGRTRFGLTKEEQTEQGYLHIILIETSEPTYYEVVDGMIYQRVDEEASIQQAKEAKLQSLRDYDKSTDVNSFTINGLESWVDRDTRTSLFVSASMEKALGKATTTIILDGNSAELPVDLCIALLTQVELYAKECYVKTQQHITNISKLETKEKVEAYDFTEGYPEKINITL